MATHNDGQIVAWETHAQTDMTIEPAPIARDWMSQSDRRFAYRCLPLVIANQAGWVIGCPADFSVRWNGGESDNSLRIRFAHGREDGRIVSHFGHGVLTFSIPFLFRTPPGINLWVKGPANLIKDGIQPLEGVVETDWTCATFTMNWKLTRANRTVRFNRGEHICMIVPVPRSLAQSLDPVQRPMKDDEEVSRKFGNWKRSREAFSAAVKNMDEEAVRQGWQREYMLGLDESGVVFPEHQTRLALRPFRRVDESRGVVDE